MVEVFQKNVHIVYRMSVINCEAAKGNHNIWNPSYQKA